MTLLEKQPTIEKEPAELTREFEPQQEPDQPVAKQRRFGWKLGIAMIVVAAAIIATAIAVVNTGGDETATVVEQDPVTEVVQDTSTPTIEASAPWPFTEDEIALMRLARAGYIPREAVDWERMELKQLIRDGHVPAAALAEPGRPILPPGAQRLPVEENNELLALYRSNSIPRQAVDWQLLELVDLVNRGHVPAEALYTID